MQKMADRMPATLSGGQQQRVALARALAPRPRLLLLDEPFANLDAGLRETLGSEVRRIIEGEGVSALLVTHDRRQALGLADTLAVLGPPTEGASSTILQVGTPHELYQRPACQQVAEMTGELLCLAGHVNGSVAATPLGELAVDARLEGSVTLGVRPEQLRFEPGSGDHTIETCRCEGGTWRVVVEGPCGIVSIPTGSDQPPTPGTRGRLHVSGPPLVWKA